ncbi:MAG TPA: RsmD family RNA methyltransferase [Solirubrobacterales bacterium]|nr:RsmD family RNA methyltransferase [Solirubrobacterales bacterium]
MARARPGPRIVAGSLGGRRLRSPAGADVRPSTERTREAIFSMLGPIEGLSALDLYCGTGALGIEALSRGAMPVTLVDLAPGPARGNVELLGLGGRCEVIGGDVSAVLREEVRRFDLVFCDPPYRLADRLGPELDSLLPARLTEAGRVIVESASATPALLSLPLLTERRYGRSLVRVHSAEGGTDD